MPETIMRRRRRRLRLLRGILSPLYRYALLLCMLLCVSLLPLRVPASAAMRMPDVSDGLITDGDGIIRESDAGNAEDGLLPEISEGLSEFVDDMGEGSTTDGEKGGKESAASATTDAAKPNLPEITTESVIMPAAAGGLWVVVLILLLLSFAVVTLVVLWGKRRS